MSPEQARNILNAIKVWDAHCEKLSAMLDMAVPDDMSDELAVKLAEEFTKAEAAFKRVIDSQGMLP